MLRLFIWGAAPLPPGFRTCWPQRLLASANAALCPRRQAIGPTVSWWVLISGLRSSRRRVSRRRRRLCRCRRRIRNTVVAVVVVGYEGVGVVVVAAAAVVVGN